MPRPKAIVPAYRQHKSTGQAVVTVTTAGGSRRDVYLGKFGSAASIAAYGKALIDWKGSGQSDANTGITVNELALAFLDHARTYYGDGSPEVDNFRYCIRPLRELFGLTPAEKFGPLALELVRDRMIELGWCRQLINRRVTRIRRIFRWAVGKEKLPASVPLALKELTGLARGRSAAPEARRIMPVTDGDVNAVLPYMTPTVRAMVEFQRRTGCRPGEVVQLCMADVDRSGPVWLYRPQQHKGLWRGKEKVIAIGPRAQAAILSVLPADLPADAPAFSPKRATVERFAAMRAERQSKVQPSQVSRKKRKPKKPHGESYSRHSYGKAITYAIVRARRAGLTVASWHANQLRHSRATELRRTHGIETASATLGHSELKTTEIYAERNMAEAVRVAGETG